MSNKLTRYEAVLCMLSVRVAQNNIHLLNRYLQDLYEVYTDIGQLEDLCEKINFDLETED